MLTRNGQKFAAWLNRVESAPKRAKGLARAMRIAAMVPVAQQMLSLQLQGVRSDRFGCGHDERDQFEELGVQLEKLMRTEKGVMLWVGSSYSGSPRGERSIRKSGRALEKQLDYIARTTTKPRVTFVADRASSLTPDGLNQQSDPYQVFIRLLESQKVLNLHKCEQCRKWFFARVLNGNRKHRFCPGGDCLAAWRRNSPEYKARQAALMRKARADAKERDQVAQRLLTR
jgi:hypothetical protein